jgi:RNA polymerase-binding protein
MSEKSLRGTRLGSNSLESEVGVDLVERHVAEYHCPEGHVFSVPFAFDAEIPALWQCKCGAEGLLVDATRPAPRATKPTRTHWDMLLERRSVAELEVLLDERLELLRAKQGTTRQKRSA